MLTSLAIEAAVAEPVEITVLTSVALNSALDELAPQYERASGNKLKITYSLISDIRKRVLAGETADIIMLSRPAMEDLAKQNKFESGSMEAHRNLGCMDACVPNVRDISRKQFVGCGPIDLIRRIIN